MANKKILIIDDEPHICEALGVLLQATGYDVSSAGGGTVALEKIKTNCPDLILLDYLLPGMTGANLLEKIKAEIEQVPPVIVISAVDTVPEFFSPKDIHSFMPKPLDMTLLLSEIEELFKV